MTLGDSLTLIWGIGPMLAYFVALRFVWRSWKRHRDRRARRAIVLAIALVITATVSAISLVSIVLAVGNTHERLILAGIAYSTFGTAGVVWALDLWRDQ